MHCGGNSIKAHLVIGLALITGAYPITHARAQASASSQGTIPVPTTVSPALQSVLAQATTNQTLPPLPTTNEGWLRYMGDPADQHKAIEALLSRFHVTMTSKVVGGVGCFLLTPAHIAAGDRNRLHVHRGGYVIGAGQDGTNEGIMLVAAAGIPVVALDCRMPPDHPYPAAMEGELACRQRAE